jgi:hypothetical protein
LQNSDADKHSAVYASRHLSLDRGELSDTVGEYNGKDRYLWLDPEPCIPAIPKDVCRPLILKSIVEVQVAPTIPRYPRDPQAPAYGSH